MWSSDETDHIPDERQVDLEEAIKMTNEPKFYLVPGRLTTEQREMFYRAEGNPAALANCIASVATPIPPCADVKDAAIVENEDDCDFFPHMFDTHLLPIGQRFHLVRRTDMEAQVARVVAEKDAEIARLRKDERERCLASFTKHSERAELGWNSSTSDEEKQYWRGALNAFEECRDEIRHLGDAP